MSEFLRTCLRQVGAYLNTPGLLTTRKCKLARHLQRFWPLFQLVGSKNSALHALCRELLFIVYCIFIIAYIFLNCNYYLVQIFENLYAKIIISLFFKFILAHFIFLPFDIYFFICSSSLLNALSL